MSDTRSDNDVKNRNRAVEQKEDELREPQERLPHDRTARPSPSRERDEEPPADAREHLENPPQTEGPRERNNEAV